MFGNFKRRNPLVPKTKKSKKSTIVYRPAQRLRIKLKLEAPPDMNLST